MLNRIRTNVTTNTAHLIYKSFILPVIDYCDTVWNCCGKVDSENLEKLHRRAAGLIVRNHCSDAALQSLAMESLEYIPQIRTEAAKKSFFYSGAQIFNYFKNM